MPRIKGKNENDDPSCLSLDIGWKDPIPDLFQDLIKLGFSVIDEGMIVFRTLQVLFFPRIPMVKCMIVRERTIK